MRRRPGGTAPGGMPLRCIATRVFLVAALAKV